MSGEDSTGPADPGVHLFESQIISPVNGTKVTVRLDVSNGLTVEVDGPLADPQDTSRLAATLYAACGVQRERERQQRRGSPR